MPSCFKKGGVFYTAFLLISLFITFFKGVARVKNILYFCGVIKNT